MKDASGDSASEVKALLFDVFGTVVDWRTSIATEARQWFDTIDSGDLDFDEHAFADDWRALYQPAMEQVRSGARQFTRLDVLHRESLAQVLADVGIDEAPSAGIDNLNRAWHRLVPWTDSVPGITRLKDKFIVAPLSNGNISLLLDMAKNAGLPWDAILGAEAVQTYKPLPAAYFRTADVLGLEPSECMLVAAHNSDLRAAAECGFHTAFVCRPTEHGDSQSTDLRAEDNWDFDVHSITELATALNC